MSNILIADDQLVMRNMFKAIFKGTDHALTLVEDGEQAYNTARRTVFDLILTDLYMPKLNGIELTEKLRQLTSYRKTPILIVSTEGATAKKEEGRKAGATGWVVKPISEQVLLPILKKLGLE